MADNTQPIDDSAVVLTDDFGRFLPCQVEQSFTLSDREYLLLLPIDEMDSLAPITDMKVSEPPSYSLPH